MNNKNYEIYSVEAEMYVYNQEYYPNCIGFRLNWEANTGFGQLTFMHDTSTKEWSYDSESMGEEFCKAVLNKWLESLMEEN